MILKDFSLLLKIGSFTYFLTIFSQYFRFHSLGFPSLYINKNILKTKKEVILSDS